MYDVIVIGSGPGGMTAALYASRADLSVLMIERGIPGGQMNNTAEIENYPGFNSILGPDLSIKMYESALQFGVENAYGNVIGIEDHIGYKTVKCEDRDYQGKAVIIASGCEHRKLEVTGEELYSGRGVSYCAVCDGAFFKEKELLVIGGGDSAVEEAVYLTQFANKVTIIHRRDELRAQKILQDRAFKNEKVDFIWNKTVSEILGNDDQVTGVLLKDTQTGEETEVKAEGLFIYVGLDPSSKPFEGMGITDAEGWIPTNEKMMTQLPGIFAIGDIRDTVSRQIASAVGDGAIAGQEVYKYLVALAEEIGVEN